MGRSDGPSSGAFRSNPAAQNVCNIASPQLIPSSFHGGIVSNKNKQNASPPNPSYIITVFKGKINKLFNHYDKCEHDLKTGFFLVLKTKL